MRRGLKAQAERLAADLRRQLACRDDHAVPLDALGAHLGVELVSATELVPPVTDAEPDGHGIAGRFLTGCLQLGHARGHLLERWSAEPAMTTATSRPFGRAWC